MSPKFHYRIVLRGFIEGRVGHGYPCLHFHTRPGVERSRPCDFVRGTPSSILIQKLRAMEFCLNHLELPVSRIVAGDFHPYRFQERDVKGASRDRRTSTAVPATLYWVRESPLTPSRPESCPAIQAIRAYFLTSGTVIKYFLKDLPRRKIITCSSLRKLFCNLCV